MRFWVFLGIGAGLLLGGTLAHSQGLLMDLGIPKTVSAAPPPSGGAYVYGGGLGGFSGSYLSFLGSNSATVYVYGSGSGGFSGSYLSLP